MKCFLCLLMTLSLVKYTQAQNDFAPVGAEWHYSWANTSEISDPGLRQGYMRLHAEKDTLILGRSSSKITTTIYAVNMSDPEPREVNTTTLEPLFVYGHTDTVFYFNGELNRFLPLYVFQVAVGDTVTYRVPPLFQGNSEDSLFRMRITAVNNITVNGVSLKQVQQGSLLDGIGFGADQNQGYTERIGVLNSYLLCHFPAVLPNTFSPELRCYTDTVLSYVLDADRPCDYIPGTTSISELAQQDNNLRLYPNPVQDDWLQLELNSAPGSVLQVQVYNINGARVATMGSSGNTQAVRLYVGDLSAGIYQVQVNTEGKVVGKGRFVKR